MKTVLIKAHSLLQRFSRDEDGATAIEYGLFAALIAAVIVTAVSTLGLQVQTGFQTVVDALPALPG